MFLISHPQDLSHCPDIIVPEHSARAPICSAQNDNLHHILHPTYNVPEPSQLGPTPRTSFHIPRITFQLHASRAHTPCLMRQHAFRIHMSTQPGPTYATHSLSPWIADTTFGRCFVGEVSGVTTPGPNHHSSAKHHPIVTHAWSTRCPPAGCAGSPRSAPQRCRPPGAAPPCAIISHAQRRPGIYHSK